MTISQVNSGLVRPFDDDGGVVVRVTADLREEAAAHLVCPADRPSRAAAARFLSYAAENRIPLDDMWTLLDAEGRPSVTCLTVPNPGRTAMVFATRAGGTDPDARISRVIDHACRRLPALGVGVAQALLEPRERAEHATFIGASFLTLATLSYLERSVSTRPLSRNASPPPGLVFEPYSDDLRQSFISALDGSYVETLDCPGLTGLRSTADVLEGHRATGEFDPGMWTLALVDGAPAGVALLNPSPRQGTIELVYLGVAQAFRGRGVGRALLDRAIELSRPRRERSITLAVDERNAPAIRLYFQAGFRRLLRRTALIRPFAPARRT
jgi:ribosomal protein S18 acetylase RimI-like enzyme